MNTRDTYKKYGLPSTYAFTPRIDILQEWNNTEVVCESFTDLEKLKCDLGNVTYALLEQLFYLNNLSMVDCITSGMVGEKRLSKWLTQGHFPESIVSTVCNARKNKSTLTLSTRYKDFVRMGKSKHMVNGNSCAVTLYKGTSAYYLHKPNTFLLLNRGDDGDFKTRVIGRLTRITRAQDSSILGLPIGQAVILFNRIYGVNVQLPTTLNGIPCFRQRYKGDTGSDVKLISEYLINYEVGIEAARDIFAGHGNDDAYDDLLKDDQIVVTKFPEGQKFENICKIDPMPKRKEKKVKKDPLVDATIRSIRPIGRNLDFYTHWERWERRTSSVPRSKPQFRNSAISDALDRVS